MRLTEALAVINRKVKPAEYREKLFHYEPVEDDIKKVREYLKEEKTLFE